MKKSIILLLLVAIAAISCRKPYDPPAISKPNGYLVVEGAINSGADSTYIKLSRTINISSNAQISPELHAIVSVQGDQNTSYPLTERGNGKYSCAGLNLDNTHQYRLSIKTTDNKQYQSAYLPVLNSPPIDSISWDAKGALNVPGVNIYVNTHDPSGKLLYYRWTYNETWAFHASFGSCCYTNGDTILARNNTTMNITDCWQSDTSSNIILGSSAKLSKDIILKAPVTQVVSTAEKLETTYSILVTQYALTPDAYNFYTNVRLTSQALGSIFDAEPSQINGNITCVSDPAEPVIGYIGVGATSTQRIFITNAQLPSWVATPFYPGCTLFYILGPGGPQLCCLYNDYGFNEVNEYINYSSSSFFSGTSSLPLIPVAPIGLPGQPPIGYTGTIRQCGDCTLRGSNKKPSFWPL
jgi:hypothetical protein